MQYCKFKPLSEDIEQFEICSYLLIYQRMNETFSDTKSFIWRLPSPYNNKAFSFETQLFLPDPSVFCFFAQFHFSLKFKVKNHKNTSLFVYLRSLVAGSNYVNPISTCFWYSLNSMFLLRVNKLFSSNSFNKKRTNKL